MINSARSLSQEQDSMNLPHLHVEAYAGYKGEETPRVFAIDGIRLSVDEILDRWYTETHSCFRVRASDGQRYVLRYDLDEQVWELVMQERGIDK
jgi:hypothetical protein